MKDIVAVFELVFLIGFIGTPILIDWWHGRYAPYMVFRSRTTGRLSCRNLSNLRKNYFEIEDVPIQLEEGANGALLRMEAGDLNITLATGSVYKDPYAELWFFRGAKAAENCFQELCKEFRGKPSSS